MVTTHWIILGLRNIPDTSVEKIKTHILCSITLNRAVYEIMWKNVVDPNRLQMTMWRMRSKYWIPKATNTHSEYIIHIAFQR